MKRFLKSPIQWILFGVGGLLWAGAAWSLFQLKLQDEDQAKHANAITIQIPDSTMLSVPDVNAYPHMLSQPLFWVSRKAQAVAAAPVNATPEAAPAPVMPEGRLVGIVDLGDEKFAMAQDTSGNSARIKIGDGWAGGKVIDIQKDKLIVSINGDKQDVPLVGEFSAPQENQQLTQQRQAQVLAQAAAKPPMPNTNEAAPVADAVAPQMAANNAVTQQAAAAAAMATPDQMAPAQTLPSLPSNAKPPPALSVKDALEARQRLMASRWSGLTGEPIPPTSGGVPVQTK